MTIEEEIAIKDVVQLHSASAVTNMLPKRKRPSLPRIRLPKRSPRSRGRRYIGSIVGHDILRHKPFTNVLGVGIILTGVLVGIWMIVSGIIYAASEFG